MTHLKMVVTTATRRYVLRGTFAIAKKKVASLKFQYKNRILHLWRHGDINFMTSTYFVIQPFLRGQVSRSSAILFLSHFVCSTNCAFVFNNYI